MITQTNDMTSGNSTKHIFFFALPLMFGNILQQLYTMVDAIIVGRAIGVEALAAVGASDWLNWMILGMVIGFCQGFSILISQNFGAEDYDDLRKSVAMSVILSLAIALITTAVVLPLVKQILVLLDTPTDILSDSVAFLRIIFAGTIIVTTYNMLAAILRALGDAKTPLVAMGIGTVINIILDLVFILAFGWGVAGAAAATITAQLMSCIYCFMAIRKLNVLKLNRQDWIIDISVIKKLLRLGAPMAFMNAIIGVGGVIVQRVINGFGVIFVAGFTAVMKLYGILELAATSFGYAVATFTGQNLGARKYTRIKQGVFSGVKMSLSIALVISIVMLVFGKLIVGLFVSGEVEEVEAVVEVAYNFLKVMSIFLVVLYLLYVYRSALQGIGDTFTPMISGIVELFMRVSAVLIFPAVMGRSGVYYVEIVAWIGATVILMSTYYFRIRRLLRLDNIVK